MPEKLRGITAGIRHLLTPEDLKMVREYLDNPTAEVWEVLRNVRFLAPLSFMTLWNACLEGNVGVRPGYSWPNVVWGQDFDSYKIPSAIHLARGLRYAARTLRREGPGTSGGGVGLQVPAVA